MAEVDENWITVGEYCECDHPKSDHDTAGQECAYGWTDEPDEEPCDCLGYVFAGHDVERRASRGPSDG